MFNDISSGAGGNVADGGTVAALLALAQQRGVARLDAEVLLAALTGTGRAQLIAFPERAVAPLAAAMFDAGLSRLAAGEPLAYITGVREFWSMPLVVMNDVLIPRPETELLVQVCLERLDTKPKRIADLGTGSGAIALALARERHEWQITATDASPAALQVATINAGRLRIGNVRFAAGRWCAALGNESFDAILSNPPYVAAGDAALAKLSFEPQSALVAGDDGYADLLRIIGCARGHLNPGGLLLLEHGATQAARVAAALVAEGYHRVACHRDLAGHERITEAYQPAHR